MVEAYRLWIRTRSTDLDYRWLAEKDDQPDQWWLSPEWGSSLLRLGEATLLLQGPRTGGGVYLGGIQSTRRDSVQSRIRYDLALMPRVGDGSGLTGDDVKGLVATWWRQRKTAPGEAWPLGEQIDEALAGESGQPIDVMVANRSFGGHDLETILALIRNLPAVDGDDEVLGSDLLKAVWVGADNAQVPSVIMGAIEGKSWTRPIAYFAQIQGKDLDGQQTDRLPSQALVLVDGDDGVHVPKGRALSDSPQRDRRPDPVHGLEPRARMILIGTTTLLVAIAVALLMRRLRTGD